MKEATINVINMNIEVYRRSKGLGSSLAYGRVLGILELAQELGVITAVEREVFVNEMDRIDKED